MVNQREKQVLEKYENEGWKTVRCGAPDFLFVKVKNGELVDFCFREVKSENDQLTYSQRIWELVLEKLGCNYKIEVV